MYSPARRYFGLTTPKAQRKLKSLNSRPQGPKDLYPDEELLSVWEHFIKKEEKLFREFVINWTVNIIRKRKKRQRILNEFLILQRYFTTDYVMTHRFVDSLRHSVRLKERKCIIVHFRDKFNTIADLLSFLYNDIRKRYCSINDNEEIYEWKKVGIPFSKILNLVSEKSVFIFIYTYPQNFTKVEIIDFICGCLHKVRKSNTFVNVILSRLGNNLTKKDFSQGLLCDINTDLNFMWCDYNIFKKFEKDFILKHIGLFVNYSLYKAFTKKLHVGSYENIFDVFAEKCILMKGEYAVDIRKRKAFHCYKTLLFLFLQTFYILKRKIIMVHNEDNENYFSDDFIRRFGKKWKNNLLEVEIWIHRAEITKEKCTQIRKLWLETFRKNQTTAFFGRREKEIKKEMNVKKARSLLIIYFKYFKIFGKYIGLTFCDNQTSIEEAVNSIKKMNINRLIKEKTTMMSKRKMNVSGRNCVPKKVKNSGRKRNEKEGQEAGWNPYLLYFSIMMDSDFEDSYWSFMGNMYGSEDEPHEYETQSKYGICKINHELHNFGMNCK